MRRINANYLSNSLNYLAKWTDLTVFQPAKLEKKEYDDSRQFPEDSSEDIGGCHTDSKRRNIPTLKFT